MLCVIINLIFLFIGTTISEVFNAWNGNWRGWYYYPESTPIDVPGTPTAGNNPDPNSVMNGGTAENSWNGFSSADITTIKRLYPDFEDAGLIGFPTVYPLTFSELNTLCPISVSGPNFENLTYKWQIGGGNLVGGSLRRTIYRKY